jgi:hypothetical protein
MLLPFLDGGIFHENEFWGFSRERNLEMSGVEFKN